VLFRLDCLFRLSVSVLSQIDKQTQTPVPLESTQHHTLAFECDIVIKSTTVQIIAFECDLVIKLEAYHSSARYDQCTIVVHVTDNTYLVKSRNAGVNV
jgi:hypothetical protein